MIWSIHYMLSLLFIFEARFYVSHLFSFVFTTSLLQIRLSRISASSISYFYSVTTEKCRKYSFTATSTRDKMKSRLVGKRGQNWEEFKLDIHRFYIQEHNTLNATIAKFRNTYRLLARFVNNLAVERKAAQDSLSMS